MQIHISVDVIFILKPDIHIDTFLYTTVYRSSYHIVSVLVECMYILMLVEQIQTVRADPHASTFSSSATSGRKIYTVPF